MTTPSLPVLVYQPMTGARPRPTPPSAGPFKLQVPLGQSPVLPRHPRFPTWSATRSGTTTASPANRGARAASRAAAATTTTETTTTAASPGSRARASPASRAAAATTTTQARATTPTGEVQLHLLSAIRPRQRLPEPLDP